MQIILQLSKDAKQRLGKSESGPGPPGGRDGASCLLKCDNRSAQLRAEAGKEAKTSEAGAKGRGACPGRPARNLDEVAEGPTGDSPYA